ncbi:MAG: OmpH family outer membrane protein [Rickettsiales bacterium]|jgi:Skp family chaperone for outer membrane proteins|nr:OmpH family outer membrane protein [Rickettsiales bacterium]
MQKNKTLKSYAKIGIVAAIVAIAAAVVLVIRGFSKDLPFDESVAEVSANAVSAADIKIAVIRMDAIQQKASVLEDVRKQREKYEKELKESLEKTQKALEKEKTEIEKSQDVLSREALQKRVVEYQQKVANFQRTVTEKAQAIDAAFQKSLVEIQEKHLDGIVNAIIAKKKLSIVLDGRFVRISAAAATALDITDDVAGALNKRITKFRMDTPKGF